jgi:20S proteasome alpha/beta subunit
MTVCIGALCEKGKAAVVAADEMVTFGPPMTLQTEPPGLKKIAEIAGSVALLYSGNVSDGEEIISSVRPNIPAGDRPSVAAIAERVRNAYAQLKRKRVEETILRPWLGVDFAQFQEMVVKASASQILGQITGMLSQHNLQTDVLVAGADDTGHHLFIITHPGVLLHMNTLGYATIGSGAAHAGISLALNKHTASDSLGKTIYRVYEAKTAAEVSPGVGKLTDMALLKDGKITFVTQQTLRVLAKVHKDHPDLSGEEEKTILESLS